VAAPVLEISLPRTHAPRRAYAARVITERFLGAEVALRPAENGETRIRLRGDDARTLTVAEGLFAQPESTWLEAESLPQEPLRERDVAAEVPDAASVVTRLPTLYGGEGRLLEVDPLTGSARLGLDVFGTAFFALTRYEEAVDRKARDEHGRFPAAASLAQRAGFLQRPLVDEYVAVLRIAIHRVWPRLSLSAPSSNVWLTHDVDWPLVTVGRRSRDVVRSAVADVVVRRSAALACRRLTGWRRARAGDLGSDPGNTFDFLMSTAEAAGTRACFNFLAGGTSRLDGAYRLGDPWIRALMRRIAGRGHELGFHGSYDSVDDAGRVAAEFGALRATAEELGIAQPRWGGRQHFLRWSPRTWRAWSAAGLRHDSSVYFAEQPGFRAGTCRPYPVYDLAADRELPLVERPLTLMDVSATRYLRLSADRTLELARRLSRPCRALGGTFVLLWHNDAVMSRGSRQLYRDLVEAIA
jgi:hypothetical protein